MSEAEAFKLVKYHQNMMSQFDEYTQEYIEDLMNPDCEGNALLLSQALEIVLKGTGVQDGKNYPKAS